MNPSKLNIIMDGRFDRQDGRILSSHMHYTAFAKRILEVFDSVEIYARSFETDHSSGLPVEGEGAQFFTVAEYQGVRSFILHLPAILRGCLRLALRREPVLLYLPGTLPIICGLFCILLRRPIHVLVVADPEDQMSRGALRHVLRPVFRNLYAVALRKICKRSITAMYVTERYLQSKYPPGKNAKSIGTSDVYLPEDAYVCRGRLPQEFSEQGIRLLYVAMMAQSYKAHEVLISCVSNLRSAGHEVSLRLVGDGPLRSELETLAKELSVHDHIHFFGKLPSGVEIRKVMDDSDVFVMTSRAEGLPRALVEAMAQGLPALSTSVGGVPELLPSQYLVPIGQTEVLSKRIELLIGNQLKLSKMSGENLARARDFSKHKIDQNIDAFYVAIKEQNKRYSR